MSESGTIQNIIFPARRETGVPSPATQEKKKEETAMLVERVREGERGAFEEFYRRLSPLVHGIVLARVPRDEAEDIVQEVFLTAYEKLDTLRDRNAVAPWIARIARNRSAEYHRRARPTVELTEDLGQNGHLKNEAGEILDVIRSLPEAYSETLVLRLVEGLTGPEIAAQTGLKHDSVRVNLHRGMKMLRQKLGVLEKK